MKILAQRPTHIYAVATVLLITKTFTVKYYDRRIQTNTVSRRRRRRHIKRDSECNGNEKAVKNNWSEKVKNNKYKNWEFTESRGRGGIKLSLRKRQ